MAQTTKASTKSRSSRSSSGSRKKPSSGTSSKRKSSTRSRSSSNARRPSNQSRSSRSAAKGPVEQTRDAVTSGAGSAGSAISTAAKKAKGPAMVAGAALVGLAGGAALGTQRKSRRKLLGVPLPKRGSLESSTKNLAGAAKDVGSFGGQLAELVTEVRRAREQLDRSNSNRRRSPIEVVLDGLTARPPKG
jgi:hypothetical protein